jgi:hypothetical protein
VPSKLQGNIGGTFCARIVRLAPRRTLFRLIADAFSNTCGTRRASRHSSRAMIKFRFVTPHRIGKWYSDLGLAQRFANAIGAGFFDRRSGRFVAYPGTRLETATVQRDR